MPEPESIEEFHARVAAATDDEGRLDWEENLPPVPDDVRRANAAFVAERVVARVGGQGPAWTSV